MFFFYRNYSTRNKKRQLLCYKDEYYIMWNDLQSNTCPCIISHRIENMFLFHAVLTLDFMSQGDMCRQRRVAFRDLFPVEAQFGEH